MPLLDQFESLFKAAAHEPFVLQPTEIQRAVVVSDLAGDAAQNFVESVRSITPALQDEPIEWSVVSGDDYDDVDQLLDILEERDVQLICSYRNLNAPAHTRHPFAIGTYLTAMTQVMTQPVLVTPTPDRQGKFRREPRSVDHVMVITDHLAGSNLLVSWGFHFTARGGELVLAHIEDDAVFERYMTAIGKIPRIDTDSARASLQRQLLKDPADYVKACSEVLGEEDGDLGIVAAIRMGHGVSDVMDLAKEHEIGLIVMNTKDDDQLAMHGLTHPIAVEIRDIPLLML
jgi:hypothetical protein